METLEPFLVIMLTTSKAMDVNWEALRYYLLQDVDAVSCGTLIVNIPATMAMNN